MAPRKKPVRKQTQTDAETLSRTIQTRTSAKGVLDEITPLTNSDQEEQTVTTLKQERVGQSRTTSLRRRGAAEASFRLREEIQPVEEPYNQSLRDTSPSVDARYHGLDEISQDSDYVYPSRQRSHRASTEAGLAERIGVRVLDVFGFVREGMESTIGGCYDASKRHWKVLLGVMVCLIVCVLLGSASLMTSRTQITDLALKEDQEMIIEEEPKAGEEIGTEKVGEDLAKWEEKIKIEMFDLIQQRMDHLELKLATYSFDDPRLQNEVQSLSGTVLSHSRFYPKEMNCAKGKYALTSCMTYRWTAPVFNLVQLSPVHPLADEIVMKGSLPMISCFPLSGQTGYLTIRFAVPASPLRVYMDKPRLSQLTNGGISPILKEFTFEGIDENRKKFTFGRFEFNETGPLRQKFDIPNPQSIQFFKIQVHSNHGNPDFTCISKIQFYGRVPTEDETEL